MIHAAVEELTPLLGTRPACRALGAAPATIYRRRRPPAPRPACVRSAPERALSAVEREAVLQELHSERFVDGSPAQAWATLLDEGRYLCSERTMYRLLAQRDEVRERRDQLTHPVYARPELLATRPNELWSWDVREAARAREVELLPPVRDPGRLQPLRRGLDRAAPGVGGRGRADDRPGSRAAGDRARPAHDPRRPGQCDAVEAGGLPAGGSRHHEDALAPLHLDGQPVLGGATLKTLKYRPGFPNRFGSILEARSFCREFFTWYNQEHRHSGIGLMPPAAVHAGSAEALHGERARVLAAAYAERPERFVRGLPRPPALPAAAWINPPKAAVAAQ